MPVIVTYKCECCGKEWPAQSKEEQPVVVGIICSFAQTNILQPKEPLFSAMWCRTCVMKYGISEPRSKTDVGPKYHASFQEKFTLLLEELGVKFED